MIPLDSSSVVSLVGSAVAPVENRAEIEPRHDAEGAVADPVGHDPGEVVDVAGVLLDQEVSVGIDGHVVGLVHLGLVVADDLAAVEEKCQRPAGIGILDVRHAQPPEPAAVAAIQAGLPSLWPPSVVRK